jgi:CheY-like chemotaxis protein
MADQAGPFRLLAIDDHRDSADLVARVAGKCGYDTRVLSNQAELSALLRNWAPDVITLDLCMPDADGIRLLSDLESIGFNGVLIIISGQEDWLRKSAGRLATLRGLKVVDDLPKPIELSKLRDLLTALRPNRCETAA